MAYLISVLKKITGKIYRDFRFEKIIVYFYWFLRLFISKKKKNRILLIPPADLTGGFGDDIMVMSFVNYYKNWPIIIYTQNIEKRPDLFQDFKNVTFLSWNNLPNYTYISKVYLLGADNLSGSYGDSEPLFKFKILKYANILNINTSIIGFSLNKNISFPVKESMRNISNKTSFYLRDPDSFQRALSFLDKSSIFLSADVAFLAPIDKFVDVDFDRWISKINSRLVLAFCPNSIHATRLGLENYLNVISEALEFFSKKYNISIIFLYHDLRNFDGYSDKDLSYKLYEMNKNKVDSFFPKNIQNGLQLKHYLQFSNFCFSGRMHLGISSYSLGKPMLGISYEDKFSGLQKMFNISFEESLIEYVNLTSYELVIDGFMDKYYKYVENVNENLAKVLLLAEKNFIQIPK